MKGNLTNEEKEAILVNFENDVISKVIINIQCFIFSC